MSATAAVNDSIVPLEDYPALRRPHEKKHSSSWIRDAAGGKIPGAFKFNGKGKWFVHLDIHDTEVRKMASPSRKEMTSIESLASRLGLDQDDIRTAMEAASR
ncbi:thioredoxin domain-containing protein [Pseudohongiella acticola]|uniref:hypothetical protein n=1 Tax=Pseudohongiella acticola TaxID=1524254 RepID=UPI0008731836|nr:hypothetical protein [Pseudohongiella acticola]